MVNETMDCTRNRRCLWRSGSGHRTTTQQQQQQQQQQQTQQ